MKGRTLAQEAGRAVTRHDFPNGGAIGHWADKSCPECCNRIAELEAEVEHWRDIASSLNEVVERQGAEVERLRAERDFWKKGIETHPWTKPGDMEKHQAAFEMIYAAFKEASP